MAIMLDWRLFSALVAGPLLMAAVALSPVAFVALLGLVVILGGVLEWVRLAGLGARARIALLTSTVVAWVLMLAAALWNQQFLYPLFALGVFWWCLMAWQVIAGGARVVPVVPGLLATLWPLLASWVLLAVQDRFFLYSFLLVVFFADVAAYAGGHLFGHEKLAPGISPGKTWAGFYSALGAGGLVALLLGWARGFPELGLLGLVGVLFAQIGDLTVSLLKRRVHAKDSSGFIPGHGGLLDRLDSLAGAAPFVVGGLILLGVLR
mgnify:CR=1 FL=1